MSGARRAAARIVSSPCSGISLPTNSACPSAVGRPPRPEDALLRADEARLDPAGAERAEQLRVRVGVRDHEIRRPEGTAVDRSERACPQAAGPEAAAVVDERVPERDERVEDDRETQPLGTAEVEVARVADDHRVGVFARAAHELRLREEQSQRRGRADAELVPAVLPDRHVRLDDLHAGAAQAGDHLRVPRIPLFVGPEVEDLQESTSSTIASARSLAGERSSWWLVISSVIRPSERSWIPTTTSSTPRISSGRPPIAWPMIFTTVR